MLINLEMSSGVRIDGSCNQTKCLLHPTNWIIMVQSDGTAITYIYGRLANNITPTLKACHCLSPYNVCL